MGQTYQEYLTIPFDLCDEKGDIQLPLLLAYCIALSGKQTRLLNRSDSYIFEHYHWVWIVTDHEMTFHQMPHCHQTISIETEAVSYNKFFCYRHFKIYDQAGQLMVEIVSHFALMDPETRKVQVIPEELVAPFESAFVKRIRRVPKLEPLLTYQEETYQVRYYDIDMNGHVNNGVYIQWAYDALGYEFLHRHRPKSLQLKYIREVKPGGTVQSRVHQDQLTSYHEVTSAGQLNAQALFTWQTIEGEAN
ncbi:acyl-[acyl-carrier-protein] thioesterase [Streptococcus halichoeri]|uniref:acyl-[acyl-carrier-protein] thioesterase n=1 Tax=Streptococcus halichoeri TaxID=254785 RepID=UPI001357E301|nr:acyl-[acyl-carrier-protein] thioesterase [Streptococcus halichoeri]